MNQNERSKHGSLKNQIKQIILSPYNLLKSLDEYIVMLDQNLNSSIDFFLDEININSAFKNIFKGNY